MFSDDLCLCQPFFRQSHPLTDVFQIGILFDQSRYVVQTHGEHPQISADRINMSCIAKTFERHVYEGKTKQNTHCHIDTKIARCFPIGNQHTKAGDQTIMLVQLPFIAFLNEMVVALQTVIQAEIQVFTDSGKTRQ